MLRTSLLAGLAVLVPFLPAQDPTPAPAEDAPVTLSIPPRWEVGTSYRLELTKTRRRGPSDAEVGTITPVDVTVSEEYPDGYLLTWTYGESEFVGMDATSMGFAAKLANLLQGTTLEMRTDEFGVPGEVANLADVRKSIDGLFELIEEQALAAGAPPAQLRQMLAPARSAFEGDLLQTSMLREPQSYYFPCGMSLRLGEVIESEDLIPNPFGGEAFPGRSTLVLESLDQDARSAVIGYRLTLDPEHTSRILLDSLKKLAAAQGAPAPEIDDLPEFRIEDVSTYTIDLGTLLPRSMSHVRTMNTGGREQTDTLSVRVMPAKEGEQ